jgi:ABC-2 type transport system permease protein
VVLFAFGEGIATERGQGWLRLMRATPLPSWVFIVAKLIVGLGMALLVVAVLFGAAIVIGGVTLPLTEWLTLGLVLVAGALPLAPIGFLIGFWARPSSAGAISLLLLLPISYASGSWQPVESLPEAVRDIAPLLPTYHYAELARAAIGLPAGDVATHIAWVLGSAAVFGAIAVWGYRRAVGTQFA